MKNINEELAEQMYKEGKTLEIIGKYFNVSHGCIKYKLLKRGVKMRKTGVEFIPKKYTFDRNFFEKIDSHEKAVILGFLCADGYNDLEGSRVKICINTKDSEYLLKINHYIQPDKPNPITNFKVTTINGTKTSQSFLHIYSQKICNDLNNLGCCPNKSLTLKFPNIPEEFLCSFMAGYFDGDGCISCNEKHGYKRNYSLEIASSDIFCQVAKVKIENILGIGVNICKKGKISTIRIYSNNASLKFLDWIYSKSPIKMDRKYNKYLDMKEYLKNYIHLSTRKKLQRELNTK